MNFLIIPRVALRAIVQNSMRSALTALGIVTPAFLSKYRRHAIVACTFIGAFLTPGDLIWTTIAMAVPLYFLYELSIVLSAIVYKRRLRREAALSQAPA